MMGADTERGRGGVQASARRRMWMRGGRRSMVAMPVEEVSQRETDDTRMSPLARELPVMKAMTTPSRNVVVPECSAGMAAAIAPNAT